MTGRERDEVWERGRARERDGEGDRLVGEDEGERAGDRDGERDGEREGYRESTREHARARERESGVTGTDSGSRRVTERE